MAHHGSTPPSVLNAPFSHRIVVVQHAGLNRAERRGRYVVPDFRRFLASRGKRNTPFVGCVSEAAARKGA